MGELKSYSSERTSLLALMREAWGLYRLHSQSTAERVLASIGDARQAERIVTDRLGLNLRDLDVLDIGPGQFLSHMIYFSVRNRVVGVDLDVIAQGFRPLDYAKMVQINGLRRAAKTITRKCFGVDRRFAWELRRQLGLGSTPRLNVLQMDAGAMSFPAASFDFVYSRAVFHHLPDPRLAIDGVVRVLRPGGASYIALHPYTSETGCLDPRIYSNQRDEIRGWPHLRPSLRSTVDSSNTYVNKLRLSEWRALFAARMPGVQFVLTQSEESSIERAKILQRQGDLLDYSLEELCCGQFAALWRKAEGQPEALVLRTKAV